VPELDSRFRYAIEVRHRTWFQRGIAALSEKPGEALRLAEKIGLSSEVDQQNQYIARQQLSKHISEYIVGRIRYLNDFERCNFKEIAQWLRLFVED
jgi:hypothetical protein